MVINRGQHLLVQPASVILTQPNEAVTEGGKLRPASRTAALIKQLTSATPHLAISGRTIARMTNFQCPAATSAGSISMPRNAPTPATPAATP